MTAADFGLTDGPYRTPSRPVPPRTVFVNPLVFYAIARAHTAHVTPTADDLPFAHLHFATPRGVWRIVGDPDCPTDYAWPESLPIALADVVRAGIEDAKQGPHVVPCRPLVRVRHEDGAEDVAELYLTHPPLVGKATIE